MAIPSEAARSRILQLMCEGCAVDGGLEEIAYRTPGYVAGDLRKLMEKAQGLAWKRWVADGWLVVVVEWLSRGSSL